MKNKLLMLIVLCCSTNSGMALEYKQVFSDPKAAFSMPEWKSPDSTLKPWFDKSTLQILEALQKNPDAVLIKQPVKCAFLLQPSGEAYDVMIWRSSGDSQIDEIAVRILEQSGKFSSPPEMLLNRRRLLAIFTADQLVRLQFDAADYKNLMDRDSRFQALKEHKPLFKK